MSDDYIEDLPQMPPLSCETFALIEPEKLTELKAIAKELATKKFDRCPFCYALPTQELHETNCIIARAKRVDDDMNKLRSGIVNTEFEKELASALGKIGTLEAQLESAHSYIRWLDAQYKKECKKHA